MRRGPPHLTVPPEPLFATDGAVTIDPDGPGPLFETPIALPLPEALNFPAP